MNDHEVVRATELLGVEHIVALERLLIGGRQALLRTLKRVVNRLRDVEELRLAVHDAPLDVEADVAHQRDQRVHDLGDPAAKRCRGEVEDLGAFERLCELANLVGKPALDDRRVVAERLPSHLIGLKHGGGG